MMPVQNILVVDDSATERYFLVELLSKRGYHVTTAESGDEAVQKAQSNHPDLILMDVVMPGLNGFQATRQLSKNDATRDIPVFMCTTKGQETDRIWGMRQGATDYLVKPVNPDELLTKILALK
jgi:twitching motility two-component system response regulator PilH